MTKKSIIILCCSLFVALAVATTALILILTQKQKIPSYDNLHIKNWETYSAFGAGFVNAESNTASAMAAVPQENGKQYTRLFGVNIDQQYEEIKFETNDDEKTEVEQQLNVREFSSFKNFSIVLMDTMQVDEITSFQYNNSYFKSNYKNPYLYLIDNKTGYIYSLGVFNFIYYFDYQIQESSNSLYFLGLSDEEEIVIDGCPTNWYIHKLSIENSSLKIEKIICPYKIFHDITSQYIVDCYNNLYFLADNDNTTYIYTNGELKSFKHNITKAMNGRIYVIDDNMHTYVNENGELTTSDFDIPTTYLFNNNNLIKTSANTLYYYCGNGSTNQLAYFYNNHDTLTPKTTIYKINFINDLEFTYEEINIESTNKYVVANDRLYFLNDNEIFYVDIQTGYKTALITDYIFSNIYSDNRYNILFEGVDSHLNNVSGTITKNDEISLEIQPHAIRVIFIQPLNK